MLIGFVGLLGGCTRNVGAEMFLRGFPRKRLLIVQGLLKQRLGLGIRFLRIFTSRKRMLTSMGLLRVVMVAPVGLKVCRGFPIMKGAGRGLRN